jgi:hypothetical protein
MRVSALKPGRACRPVPAAVQRVGTDVRWATTDPIACSGPRVEWA